MPNRNDPARRGEAVECLLPGDVHGYSIGALRPEVLTVRFHLCLRRASLIASFAWEGAHG